MSRPFLIAALISFCLAAADAVDWFWVHYDEEKPGFTEVFGHVVDRWWEVDLPLVALAIALLVIARLRRRRDFR
jgi:hypothetical protein